MKHQKEIFDLTSAVGCSKAAEFLSNEKIKKGARVFFPIPFLMFDLGKALMDKIFSTPEEMKNVVVDLIKEGKERGVREMDIKIKDKSGIDLGCNIPDMGVNIGFKAGPDKEIIVNVKYD